MLQRSSVLALKVLQRKMRSKRQPPWWLLSSGWLEFWSCARRSQDFCLGGGHPADATRYMFRHLRWPTRFSGGSSRNFPWSPCADQIQWGGGSSGNFCGNCRYRSIKFPQFRDFFLHFRGAPADHPPFMHPHGDSRSLCRSAYTFKERNNINSLENKNIYQKFGGGAMAPVGPPDSPLLPIGALQSWNV